MRLNGTLLAGIGLLGFGVAATLLTDWRIICCGLVVGGFFKIRRGVFLASFEPQKVPAPSTGAPDEALPIQLAGKACVQCTRKLLGNFEGRACGGCGSAVHRDCYRAHRDAAHPKVGGYRDSPR